MINLEILREVHLVEGIPLEVMVEIPLVAVETLQICLMTYLEIEDRLKAKTLELI